MPSPEVEKLVNDIMNALRVVKDNDLDEAVSLVRNDLEKLMEGLSVKLADKLEEAREEVTRQLGDIEILHHHSVLRKKPKWYFGPRPSDLHWPAVRQYMVGSKDWHIDDVAAIDEASNEIVSLLENPVKAQFSCRGLVVGHVQSGKTANMTAVIAKALDAGYNTIIVLAGLTNKLRYQTQMRLFDDLVQRNLLHWQVLTPNEIDRDFRAPPQGGFLAHSDKAQLAVIKKNVSPLGQLRDAVERTLNVALNRLRILVIDDECDHASVNAARGELDMTAINQRIRQLLAKLPAVAYVGYTATPFANVLIDPYTDENLQLDDLYPRNFITALPTPERYFGTERLFGRPPVDPENIQPDEEGLDMIRIVPEKDECLLQPASQRERDNFHPEMPNSLEEALLYFLACCAARRARGDGDKHMTMLVHTSAYVVMHERLSSLIEGWYEVNRACLRDRQSEIGQRMANIWLAEQGRLPADITEAQPVSLEEIFAHLPGVLDAIEFPVENGASTDRIDYNGPPRTYIVVGGSILARGLTLESLMVSYFLRSANQYDTLLQMGRWFGYRKFYEDLPRIWMTEDLKLRFRALAAVEQEIRDEIEQYRLQDLTPMEIAVRIRAIPGMAITGANKMRAARQCAVSFWGSHRQTFRFEHLNAGVLRRNWDAAAELVSRADTLGLRDTTWGKKLWRGVPKSSIIRFLKTYETHPTHADLRPEILLTFLEKSDSRLDKWNVGIVEAKSGDQSEKPLGMAGRVHLVTRARLEASQEIADIKALMSRGDIRFDWDEEVSASLGWEAMKETRLQAIGQMPLLLLYAIDKTSAPKRSPKPGRPQFRVPLDAQADVLGYGIVFPGSVTEGGDYISVDLNPLSADELDEIAAEEEAQAEAAGVI